MANFNEMISMSQLRVIETMIGVLNPMSWDPGTLTCGHCVGAGTFRRPHPYGFLEFILTGATRINIKFAEFRSTNEFT